jgi:hypothetical protein
MNSDPRPATIAQTKIKSTSTTSWIGNSLRRGSRDGHRHVFHVFAGGILHVLATDKRNGFPSESFGRVAGYIHLVIDEPIELVALPTPHDRHEHPQDLRNFHKGTLTLSMGALPCVRYTRNIPSRRASTHENHARTRRLRIIWSQTSVPFTSPGSCVIFTTYQERGDLSRPATERKSRC